METKNPGQRTLAGASVSIAADTDSLTEKPLNLQAATVTELRALHLIARHHARPELALALAALAYGGAHG